MKHWIVDLWAHISRGRLKRMRWMRAQSRKLNAQYRRQIWMGCRIYRSELFDFQAKK